MNQRFSITPATAATDMAMTDSEHRTLSVIGIYGNREGWCWPSQSTLAEQRGVSRKTINVHIKRLIELGYLNIHPRYDEETGAQKSNMMQIKFDYAPNVTGGVTSKTLQGVSPLEGYRGGEVQEVTHNALVNAPIEPSIYMPQSVQEFITTLSKISKTPYLGKNETAYTEAAYYLHGLDAKRADIDGFGSWWGVNGFYPGKPALKTVLDEWSNFKSGVTAVVKTNGNGNGNGRFQPAEQEPERVGGVY